MDANFLMIPGEFGVDVFEEIGRLVEGDYELIVPEPVVGELQNLSRKGGEEGKAARIGLELIKEDVNIVKTESKGDESVLEVAEDVERPLVATNDRKLKERCKERSFPVIYLRTKDHLEVG